VEISGALRADNLEPLLQMLAANYSIRAQRGTDGRIELQRGK
jgi:ferric-dicitrate binding protein FerR (iron transport regulator)